MGKGGKEKCDVLWKQPALFVAEEFSEESQFVAGLSIPYPFRIPFRNKFSVYLVHWHCGGCKLQHTKLSRACIPAMLAEHTQQCPQHPHVKTKTFSLYCKIHVVKKTQQSMHPTMIVENTNMEKLQIRLLPLSHYLVTLYAAKPTCPNPQNLCLFLMFTCIITLHLHAYDAVSGWV